jgi:hypothetical protein
MSALQYTPSVLAVWKRPGTAVRALFVCFTPRATVR